MPTVASSQAAKVLRVALALGAVWLALPSPVLSQQNPASSCLSKAFGPEVFARGKGAPVTVVHEFSADLFEPPFVLHLLNGDPDGRNRVSSAEVWLNGQLLLSPSAFSQQVSGYELPVSLTNPSRLEVRIASKPGSHLKIWIAGLSSVVSPYEQLVVTPAGGRFTLTTGPVLAIPPGAVRQPTTIGACLTSEALVIPVVESYGLLAKQFMGGIELSPPDLQFDVPMTVTVPVRRPQFASQIPLLLAVDKTTGLYSVAPQDLIYDPRAATVTMTLPPPSLAPAAHAGLMGSATLADTQQVCKREQQSWQVVGADSPEIVNMDCTRPENQNSCACGNFRITTVGEELSGGGASGECYYITDFLLVEYLDPRCQGQPEFTLSIREKDVATPEITPRPVVVGRCDTKQVTATVCSAAGRMLPATFVRWELSGGRVRITPTTGASTNVTAGPETGTLLEKLYANGSCGTEDFVQVDVPRVKLDVKILDAPAKMRTKQKAPLTATVTEAGRQLNCETITWGTDRKDVVAVDPDTGMVTAGNSGVARVTATPSSAPEDSVFVDIKVVGPRYVVMNPPAKWITVDERIGISAQVLDEDMEPMTGIPVEWSITSTHVTLVTSEADPPTATVRGVSAGTGTVVARAHRFPGDQGRQRDHSNRADGDRDLARLDHRVPDRVRHHHGYRLQSRRAGWFRGWWRKRHGPRRDGRERHDHHGPHGLSNEAGNLRRAGHPRATHG